MSYPSYCCQKCGTCIGWVGRFLFPFMHKCPPEEDIPVRDATALLEECLTNGVTGPECLYAWFQGERHVIEQTIKRSKINL